MACYTQYWEMYLTAGVVTRPYYFGGARVAQQSGTTRTNVYQSHPTGTKFMQDSVGASVGAITYYPYGSTRSETGTISTDKRFTGQRLASAKGLYFHDARYGACPEAAPGGPKGCWDETVRRGKARR